MIKVLVKILQIRAWTSFILGMIGLIGVVVPYAMDVSGPFYPMYLVPSFSIFFFFLIFFFRFFQFYLDRKIALGRWEEKAIIIGTINSVFYILLAIANFYEKIQVHPGSFLTIFLDYVLFSLSILFLVIAFFIKNKKRDNFSIEVKKF